jgi:thiamine-phosphate pyrophosphorylase
MSDKTPRLYLATPILDDPGDFPAQLDAALAAGDVACLLPRLRAGDEARAERIIRAVAAPAQARGVALIVEGSPELALRAGADGAHIRGSGEALQAAVKQLSPGYIVGAGGLDTRDDAMRAGEAGVDYLLFGDAGADGQTPPLDALIERVQWWAEIFNTPCVALAQRLEDIGPLAAAGADFIMLGDCVWSDPRGPGATVAEAVARLAQSRIERIVT